MYVALAIFRNQPLHREILDRGPVSPMTSHWMRHHNSWATTEEPHRCVPERVRSQDFSAMRIYGCSQSDLIQLPRHALYRSGMGFGWAWAWHGNGTERGEGVQYFVLRSSYFAQRPQLERPPTPPRPTTAEQLSLDNIPLLALH